MRTAKDNAVLTTVGDGTDMTMPSYSPASISRGRICYKS